jgi:hypothetical protein
MEVVFLASDRPNLPYIPSIINNTRGAFSQSVKEEGNAMRGNRMCTNSGTFKCSRQQDLS